MKIEPKIQAAIQQRLATFEKIENVRVLYAVESGSRAWGFASKDSDYDIRFVYVHTLDWYLSIEVESQRDVIERPVENDLDFAGWDIRKALKLFSKSNPALLEWLDSGIVYIDREDFAKNLRELRDAFFTPQKCVYHYLHMAQNNYRAYLRGPEVQIKKYFYVLRPLLAIRWMEQGRGVVPMKFEKLLETAVDEPKMVAEVKKLLKRKLAADELAEGPQIPEIHEFLDLELVRANKVLVPTLRSRIDIELLNNLYREHLK